MQSTCEGPLGFPMTDAQAASTEGFLKAAAGPFQHILTKLQPLETQARTDISWITTENPDRYNHIVLADGMDDTAYALNPIVTLNHDYQSPAIGRSLWRQPARRAGTKGVQAMTHYPPKPTTIAGDWAPELVFQQILAGILNGKSIGFIPLEVVEPINPDYPLVVKRWALIEYAVGALPVQPDATVIQVNKTLTTPPPPLAVSLAHRVNSIDLDKILQNLVAKLRGSI